MTYQLLSKAEWSFFENHQGRFIITNMTTEAALVENIRTEYWEFEHDAFVEKHNIFYYEYQAGRRYKVVMKPFRTNVTYILPTVETFGIDDQRRKFSANSTTFITVDSQFIFFNELRNLPEDVDCLANIDNWVEIDFNAREVTSDLSIITAEAIRYNVLEK